MTISLFYGCCCVCIHTYPNHLCFIFCLDAHALQAVPRHWAFSFCGCWTPPYIQQLLLFSCRLKVAQRLRLEYPTGLHKDLLAH